MNQLRQALIEDYNIIIYVLDADIKPECIEEMNQLRQALMEDYQIDPLIMSSCSAEIKNECKGKTRQGKTLHCLMDLAKDEPKNKDSDKISDMCIRAVSINPFNPTDLFSSIQHNECKSPLQLLSVERVNIRTMIKYQLLIQAVSNNINDKDKM